LKTSNDDKILEKLRVTGNEKKSFNPSIWYYENENTI
jgi:hypothetical protein